MDLYIEPLTQSFVSKLLTENRYVSSAKNLALKIITLILSGTIFGISMIIITIFKIKNFIDSGFDAANKIISTVLSYNLIGLLALLDVFTYIKQSIEYSKIKRIEYSQLDELFWKRGASLKLGDNYQTLIVVPPNLRDTEKEESFHKVQKSGGFEIIDENNEQSINHEMELDEMKFNANFIPSPKLKSFFTKSDDKKHWWRRENKHAQQSALTTEIYRDHGSPSYDSKHYVGPDILVDSRDEFGIPYYNLSQHDEQILSLPCNETIENFNNPTLGKTTDSRESNCSCSGGTVKEKEKALEHELDFSNKNLLVVTKEIDHNSNSLTESPLKPNLERSKSITKAQKKFKMLLQLNSSPDFINKFSTNVLKGAISSSPKSLNTIDSYNTGIDLLAFSSNKENIIADI